MNARVYTGSEIERPSPYYEVPLWVFAQLYPTTMIRNLYKYLREMDGDAPMISGYLSCNQMNIRYREDITHMQINPEEKNWFINGKCKNRGIPYYETTLDIFKEKYPDAYAYYELGNGTEKMKPKNILVRFNETMNVPERSSDEVNRWLFYTGEKLEGDIPDISFVKRSQKELAVELQELLGLPAPDKLESQQTEQGLQKAMQWLKENDCLFMYALRTGKDEKETVKEFEQLLLWKETT